jgi:hypothetical protein
MPPTRASTSGCMRFQSDSAVFGPRSDREPGRTGCFLCLRSDVIASVSSDTRGTTSMMAVPHPNLLRRSFCSRPSRKTMRQVVLESDSVCAVGGFATAMARHATALFCSLVVSRDRPEAKKSRQVVSRDRPEAKKSRQVVSRDRPEAKKSRPAPSVATTALHLWLIRDGIDCVRRRRFVGVAQVLFVEHRKTAHAQPLATSRNGAHHFDQGLVHRIDRS